jgi:carbon-monoxide dehydrogenase medium subunit
MRLWNKYIHALNVEHALQILADAPGSARLIAGGTDLLLDIQQGRTPIVDTLIDISQIAELQEISVTPDHVFIGSAVTFRDILRSDVLRRHAVCLIEACGIIGGPQVRSVATIGGNVANALPAGDGIIALLALDAEALIVSSQPRRWMSLEKLFVEPGIPSFDRNRELIKGFRFSPRNAREGCAFTRVMRPQGISIAILNMAVWLRIDSHGTVEDIHIALGPAGPRPFRARGTEKILRFSHPDDQMMIEAHNALLVEAQLRTSMHRATKTYRQRIAGVLLRQTFHTASDRAKEDPTDFT